MTKGFFKKNNIVTTRSFTRGFTLIELMVSLTVFSIVMVVSVGTLLTLININAKAQALYSATTNLSFALDSMSRELRTGYRYHCVQNGSSFNSLPTGTQTQDCAHTNPGEAIAFVREKDAKKMGYRLVEVSGRGVVQQKQDAGAWMPITSEDIDIDMFEVLVENSAKADGEQPTVTLRIVGETSNGLDTPSHFNIQTRIVQRRLDI